MSESFESLRALFSDAGYTFVDPPIVFEASVFVELAGEDLRRRLYLTSAADGTELALRPDFTIPVCLHHLASGKPNRHADYAYLGPVFRQRQGESGEFLQAGVESLGRADRAAADGDMLQLALAAVRRLGVKKPAVKIGDSGLFAAVLGALNLPEPWRRRLARAFGDPERLKALIGRAEGGGKGTMPTADRKAARLLALERLQATGLVTIGGRSADEIADRVVEKAALAEGIEERARKTLGRFLAVSGDPAKSLKALRTLAARDKLDIDKALDQFEGRLTGFTEHGINPATLAFAADFGRRLDYYTGFVFEIHDAVRSDGRQIVGGGRYDRLASLLPQPGGGTPHALPAVGFAIWLDRIKGAR